VGCPGLTPTLGRIWWNESTTPYTELSESRPLALSTGISNRQSRARMKNNQVWERLGSEPGPWVVAGLRPRSGDRQS